MSDDAKFSRELDLRDYLRVLRRRRGLIVLTVVLVVGVALAYSLHQTPVYKATTQVLIRFSDGSQGQQSQLGSTDQGTELLLMQAPAVREAVTKQLGHAPDVSVQVVQSTNVVAISAQSTSARGAARDADTYARVYIDVRRKQTTDELLAAVQDLQAKIQQLDARSGVLDFAVASAIPGDLSAVVAQQASERSRIATQRSLYSAQLDQEQSATTAEGTNRQIIANASVPTSPVKPTPTRNVLVALLVGLVLGIGGAFVREHFDDTVRTKDDIERIPGGLVVVGMIPLVRGRKYGKVPYLVSSASPNSSATEAYRTLRTSLQFLTVSAPVRSLQVTSPSAAEGKTTTVANLAVTAARSGRRVIVACCDLRRPRVHEFFGLGNEIGLTSVLLGQALLSDALQSVEGEPNVTVLASGPPPPNPDELLSLPRTAEVLEWLREHCDLLIVDSPPVLPVTDALIVSGLVDASLIVCTVGSTTKHRLRRAVELLRQVDAPVVGAVLNYPESRSGNGYGSGYGYGYGPQTVNRHGNRRRRDRKAARTAD